jgi:hypothetical protein
MGLGERRKYQGQAGQAGTKMGGKSQEDNHHDIKV